MHTVFIIASFVIGAVLLSGIFGWNWFNVPRGKCALTGEAARIALLVLLWGLFLSTHLTLPDRIAGLHINLIIGLGILLFAQFIDILLRRSKEGKREGRGLI